MTKFTKWFDPHSFPVRDGVYQRGGFSRHIVYAYWSNGFGWSVSDPSPERAREMFQHRSLFHYMPWRGLAKGPT